MKKYVLVILAVLCTLIGGSVMASELEGRGLVAVKTDSGVFLSWRYRVTDTDYTLYRDGEELVTVDRTNYLDPSGTADSVYTLEGEAATVWADGYYDIPIVPPTAEGITYNANDASVGDLDGDGTLEIVLKWDPSDSKDSSQNGNTGMVYFDAYRLTGERMWRMCMGRNVRAGAHDTQFLVYDFDGDGKAEIAMRTADGTTDALGNVIGDPNALWTNSSTGKNLTGPLFLTVFEGATGRAVTSVPYDPQSNEPSTKIFGDDYGNRSERYLAAVAYLDGKSPSMVFVRGYYFGKKGQGPGRTVVAAFDYKNGTITKRWRFDTMDSGNDKYIGQGNHNLSVGDGDGDGRDEIYLGSLALDHDGSVLWCSHMGHGDAQHLGKFMPGRKGLQFFTVHEDKSDAQSYGYSIHDAATGEVLFQRNAGGDTGRGMIANIGDFGGSFVAWGSSGVEKINSLNETLNLSVSSMNFRIFWDGDLYDELLDGTSIYTVTPQGKQQTIFDAAALGCASNNGTKSNPCLQADLFGDWREEVIWRTSDNRALRIFTTTIPTPFSFAPLMEDHVYRMGIVWQNVAYNQPPHVSYYLPSRVPDKTAAREDLEAIVLPTETRDNLTLPTRGTYGSTIVWETSDSDVIAADGSVTVGAEDRQVRLTATAKKNSTTITKKYYITVQRDAPTWVSGEDWSYHSFAAQSGTFYLSFEVTPQSLSDAYIGIAGRTVTPSDWNSAAIAVRLQPSGVMDARNGAAYAATTPVSYTPGETYFVRLAINTTARTYSVYVTDAAGVTHRLADRFAFRSDAPTSVAFDKVIVRGGNGTAAGLFSVSDFAVDDGRPILRRTYAADSTIGCQLAACSEGAYELYFAVYDNGGYLRSAEKQTVTFRFGESAAFQTAVTGGETAKFMLWYADTMKPAVASITKQII